MKLFFILFASLSISNLSLAQVWSAEAEKRERDASRTTIVRENEKKINKYNLVWAIVMSIGSSSVPGESESYSGPVTNTSVGVIVPFTPLSKRTELIGGIRFSREGSKYESSEYVPGGYSRPAEGKALLSYLRAPIFLRINSNKSFYADAGIQPGVLLSAKDKFKGQTNSLKEDYNSFDMGLLLGVGYQFKGHFGANINYAPGISNINKKGGPNDGKKDRNSTIFVGVHYIL
jgi:hypothetical protein